MASSKTTIVNDKKMEALTRSLYNLAYVICRIRRSSLWMVKAKDYKKVLEISTLWKTELIDLEKNSKNSSTMEHDVDG